MNRCNWLKINDMIELHSLITLWKTINLKIPFQISKKITINQDKTIKVTKPRLQTVQIAYLWRTATQYNLLPKDLIKIETLPKFKKTLKNYLKLRKIGDEDHNLTETQNIGDNEDGDNDEGPSRNDSQRMEGQRVPENDQNARTVTKEQGNRNIKALQRNIGRNRAMHRKDDNKRELFHMEGYNKQEKETEYNNLFSQSEDNKLKRHTKLGKWTHRFKTNGQQKMKINQNENKLKDRKMKRNTKDGKRTHRFRTSGQQKIKREKQQERN